MSVQAAADASPLQQPDAASILRRALSAPSPDIESLRSALRRLRLGDFFERPGNGADPVPAYHHLGPGELGVSRTTMSAAVLLVPTADLPGSLFAAHVALQPRPGRFSYHYCAPPRASQSAAVSEPVATRAALATIINQAVREATTERRGQGHDIPSHPRSGPSLEADAAQAFMLSLLVDCGHQPEAAAAAGRAYRTRCSAPSEYMPIGKLELHTAMIEQGPPPPENALAPELTAGLVRLVPQLFADYGVIDLSPLASRLQDDLKAYWLPPLENDPGRSPLVRVLAKMYMHQPDLVGARVLIRMPAEDVWVQFDGDGRVRAADPVRRLARRSSAGIGP